MSQGYTTQIHRQSFSSSRIHLPCNSITFNYQSIYHVCPLTHIQIIIFMTNVELPRDDKTKSFEVRIGVKYQVGVDLQMDVSNLRKQINFDQTVNCGIKIGGHNRFLRDIKRLNIAVGERFKRLYSAPVAAAMDVDFRWALPHDLQYIQQ